MDDVYLPSAEEIRQRSEFTREMRDLGWPQAVITSIMIHNMPTIDTARSLIKQRGPQLALLRISHMIDHFDVNLEGSDAS